MSLAFSYGFYVGFFAVLFSVALFLAIISMIENNKKKEYLIEIDSIEDFEKWKKKGGN
jgi:type IV secretory pathway component VirB8